MPGNQDYNVLCSIGRVDNGAAVFVLSPFDLDAAAYIGLPLVSV
jgi:hypothetical protein